MIERLCSASFLLILVILSGCEAEARGRATAPADVIGHLEPEPLLTIGDDDSPSSVPFSDVSGVVALPDNSIVVANWHSPPQLYRFDEQGTLLNTLGGAGEAPGEFRSASWLRASQDTLVVYDATLARLTRFLPTGELVSTMQLPQGRFGRGAGWRPLGILSGGDILARPMFLFSGGGGSAGRSDMPIVRVDPGTGIPVQIAVVPGTEYAPRPGTSRAMGVIFGKSTAVDLTRSRIFITTGEELRTDEYSQDGTVVRTYASAATRRRVTEADVDAFFDLVIGTANPNDRQLVEQEVRSLRGEATVASEFPAAGDFDNVGLPTSSVVVDDSGRVWLAEYVSPLDTEAYWAVFSGDGTYLGRVTVPAKFWIKQVKEDVALGFYQDEDLVESVRTYRIAWRQP